MIPTTDSPTDSEAEASSPSRRRRFSLLIQIAAFLTLALLPVGLIAVIQTQRAIESSRETYLSFLQAETNSAATPDREAIVNAFGLARGLADAIAVLDASVETCLSLMRRAAVTTPSIVFVGFLEDGGLSRCNNLGETQDYTGVPVVADLFSKPRGYVAFSASSAVTQQPVVVVSEPVYDAEGEHLGFVAISFPPQALDEERAADLESVQFITFNIQGDVLTANIPGEDVDSVIPQARTLVSLAETAPSSFSALSRGGSMRDYSVVPIVPGRAYALGSWRTDDAFLSDRPIFMTGLAFPVIMWIVSLVVALLAIRRLVIHPIRDLGARMRIFSDSRTLVKNGAYRTAPEEIRRIDETFESMARKIVRDEADLENTLYEREVLLKEVHHRAKNNLQLMSSIINMQIRNAGEPEAREVLRSVQGRLRSLATVHRTLYEAPELSQVEFDILLRDLVGELTTIGAERLGGSQPEMSLEKVTLVPDQAAPLAILAVEAITNAFKYVGDDADGRRRVCIGLQCSKTEEGDAVTLSIENTVRHGAENGSAGLGKQLIAALAQQLPADVVDGMADGLYRVEVRFLRRDLEPDC